MSQWCRGGGGGGAECVNATLFIIVKNACETLRAVCFFSAMRRSTALSPMWCGLGLYALCTVHYTMQRPTGLVTDLQLLRCCVDSLAVSPQLATSHFKSMHVLRRDSVVGQSWHRAVDVAVAKLTSHICGEWGIYPNTICKQ